MNAFYFRVTTDRRTTEIQFEDLLEIADAVRRRLEMPRGGAS
jgi:hypothetical protein